MSATPTDPGQPSLAGRLGAAPGAALSAELSAEQSHAVFHGALHDQSPPPLLIIAGAGSGKTKTLAARVARLVAAGIDPQRILLMTFSRRAAAELERRTGQLVQHALGLAPATRPPALPWSGTFHSVGARLLRDYAPRIGLNDAFTILDRADAADLMGLARHELGLSETRNRFPSQDTCLSIYSRTVNSQSALESVLNRHFTWCAAWQSELKRLFGRYALMKAAQDVLDYDDLLLYWLEMVLEPAIGAELAQRFSHVLVDEYQDTNRLQAAILLALKPDGAGVTVVGDDAQAIYSFRAADVRNILDFPGLFTPAAATVTLARNYRSTPSILAASNAVIALARERFTKNLFSERPAARRPLLVTVRDESEQALYVAQGVLALREEGVPLKAQAVLFRSASHSAALELELARRNIPFMKYGGLKFLEATHIKDVLAMLRWAENPKSRLAGFRAVQLSSGIGPATAARLADHMEGAADPCLAIASFEAPAAALADWPDLVATFKDLRQAGGSWPADFERARRWYEPHLDRLFENAAARRQDLEQLGRIASTYATRERFLTELTLDPPEVTSAQAGPPHRDEDYLVLSTIHSAKGQEWSAVTVLNVVDGCLPSDMATGSDEEIEEERRLLYVAMTRAKDRLELIVPQRFYVHQQVAMGDRHVSALRSRFLPEAVFPHFEFTAWPVLPEGQHANLAAAAAPMVRDVGARVRSRWD